MLLKPICHLRVDEQQFTIKVLIQYLTTDNRP